VYTGDEQSRKTRVMECWHILESSVNFVFDSIFVIVMVFVNEKVFSLSFISRFESIIVFVSFLYYRFFNIVLPMLLEKSYLCDIYIMTFKLQMTTRQTLRFAQDVCKMSDDEVVSCKYSRFRFEYFRYRFKIGFVCIFVSIFVFVKDYNVFSLTTIFVFVNKINTVGKSVVSWAFRTRQC